MKILLENHVNADEVLTKSQSPLPRLTSILLLSGWNRVDSNGLVLFNEGAKERKRGSLCILLLTPPSMVQTAEDNDNS